MTCSGRRRQLRRELGALGLPLLDNSFLCRLYIQGDGFLPEWPTFDSVVRRMAEMHFLHEWTPYHERIAQLERDTAFRGGLLWRRAEELVLGRVGGWPPEWPWLKRVRLLRRSVALLRIRLWLCRRIPAWKERFYDPDRGAFLAIGRVRFHTDNVSGRSKRARRAKKTAQ